MLSVYALVVAVAMSGISVTQGINGRDACEQIGKAAVALVVKHHGHADYTCMEVK
jgi:hypothetical protein